MAKRKPVAVEPVQPALAMPATDDEIKRAILQRMRDWQRKEGMTKVIGPQSMWIFILFTAPYDLQPLITDRTSVRRVIRENFQSYLERAITAGWKPTETMAPDPWWRSDYVSGENA